MEKKEGLRYNQNKIRTDLLPADVILNIAQVLTDGAKKYADRNWEAGMPWMKNVVGSLQRHLLAFEMGEDIDPESGLPHVDHVACNAVFLSRYFRSCPEYDDRRLPYIWDNKRIALDVDGVMADFSSAFSKRCGIKGVGNPSWYMSYKAKHNGIWEEVKNDKEFWLNLDPVLDADTLLFEPVAYVTAREIPVEWTEQWIEKNGFPCNPVYTIEANGGEHGSKADILKEIGVDIFIDDHYKHFIELNRAGVTTFLLDTYHNSRYDVGSRRIKHPNEVLSNFK